MTSYIDADVRDPDAILHEAGRVLDITHAVGLVLMGVLAHIADFDEVRRIVARLLGGLPVGSALIYYDGTNTRQEMQVNQHYANSGAVPYQVRSPEQLRTVFNGLDLGYDKGDPAGRGSPNSRNGTSEKTLSMRLASCGQGLLLLVDLVGWVPGVVFVGGFRQVQGRGQLGAVVP